LRAVGAWALLPAMAIGAALTAGCSARPAKGVSDESGEVIDVNAQGSLKISWLGHAAFLIVAPDGTRILTDPFDPKVPYGGRGVEADIITISHEHFDHNHVGMASGRPKCFHGLAEEGARWADIDETCGAVSLETVPTFHDDSEGSERGKNAVFIIEVDGTRIVHLGDLGHPLDDGAVRRLGRVDVLLVPVGGFYTIGAGVARSIVNRLKPAIVIPMHYKTPEIADWPISDEKEFLQGFDRVKRFDEEFVAIPRDLPDPTEVWVLPYRKR